MRLKRGNGARGMALTQIAGSGQWEVDGWCIVGNAGESLRAVAARRRCAGAFRRSVRTGGGGGGVSTLANVGRAVKEAVRCEARERMCADVVASGRRPIPYSAKFALPLGGILHVDVRRHDVRACNLPQCALGPHTVWRLRKGIYTVFRRGFVSGGVRRYPFCRRVDAPSHFEVISSSG